MTEQVETRRDLYGLAATGGQRALCVGDGGVVIERTTISAAALPSLEAGATPVGRASPWESVDGCPTDRVLWSVWGSDSQVVAVGDEGAIVTFDGQRWRAHSAPSPLHLHGVWGRRADQVYAVGDFATVIEFDGMCRREIHRLGIDVSAVAVAGFGPHDLFVVGDEGLILRSVGCRLRARRCADPRRTLRSVGPRRRPHPCGRRLRRHPALERARVEQLFRRHRGISVQRPWTSARRHRGGGSIGRHGRISTVAAGLAASPAPPPTCWAWRRSTTRDGSRSAPAGPHLSGTAAPGSRRTPAPMPGLRAVWVDRGGTAYAVGDGGTVRKRLP